jgi:ribosome-associated protein
MAKKKKVADESEILTEAIVNGMLELKAKDIVILDMRTVGSSITDFFVICTGESNTQVDAIANSIRKEVQKIVGEPPHHEEGFSNSEWILLDYVNVVAHIFQPDHRKYYNLEKLWADAEIKQIAA